mgnify:CR=1
GNNDGDPKAAAETALEVSKEWDLLVKKVQGEIELQLDPYQDRRRHEEYKMFY